MRLMHKKNIAKSTMYTLSVPYDLNVLWKVVTKTQKVFVQANDAFVQQNCVRLT